MLESGNQDDEIDGNNTALESIAHELEEKKQESLRRRSQLAAKFRMKQEREEKETAMLWIKQEPEEKNAPLLRRKQELEE